MKTNKEQNRYYRIMLVEYFDGEASFYFPQKVKIYNNNEVDELLKELEDWELFFKEEHFYDESAYVIECTKTGKYSVSKRTGIPKTVSIKDLIK